MTAGRTTTCETSERDDRRAHALRLLLEEKRHVDRMSPFDVDGQVPGGLFARTSARQGSRPSGTVWDS